MCWDFKLSDNLNFYFYIDILKAYLQTRINHNA